MRATVASMTVTGALYLVKLWHLLASVSIWLGKHSDTFTAVAAIVTISLGVRAHLRKEK